MIYILLLYQTYSCTHYARLFAKLPAEKQDFKKTEIKKNQYFYMLESLSNQINLFLVKGVYESVSNVQHQNGVYKYGKNILAIEDDIQSLTIGLDSLKDIEKDKRNQKFEMLMKAIGVFGIVSVVNDIFGFIELFADNGFRVVHSVVFGVIVLVVGIMYAITKCNKKR